MEDTTVKNATATDGKANAKASVKSDIKPVYTITQLADGYKTFGTTRAIVECALKLAGKDSFTIDEARKIINAFKNKR